MRPIGRWVIGEACRQLAAWGDPTIGMHLNVSAAQLADPELAEHLVRLTGLAGLTPSRLTLELSERAMLSRVGTREQGLARLHELRELVSGSRSTTSAPATRACRICRSFRSRRSRSIARSCIGSVRPTSAPRWSARSSCSRTPWASR